MLNIFPTMFLALIAHAILRIVLGLVLCSMGYRHFVSKRPAIASAVAGRYPRLTKIASFSAVWMCLVELVLGGLFIAGFLTQIAAIGAVILSLKMLYLRNTLSYPLVPQPLFWILTLGISISLFITGAGAFAVDMPI